MPCPHNEITIVQRSQRQSAVAAAAYQSAGKHGGDGKENRQDDLQGSCPFQQYQHRNHER